MGEDHRDYERIEKAIQYLNRHSDRQPSLAEVAQSVHLSEFHFQRTAESSPTIGRLLRQLKKISTSAGQNPPRHERSKSVFRPA